MLTPFSVVYRTYPIGLAPGSHPRAFSGGPHSGLVWLALLSAQTSVNGLVTYPKRVSSGVIMGQPPVGPIWDRFDFTDARLSRSKALYEKNLILLDESRRLIAMSRRLLNRAWGIGGSSGDDLCQAVCDRLVSGALFPVPGRLGEGMEPEKYVRFAMSSSRPPR